MRLRKHCHVVQGQKYFKLNLLSIANSYLGQSQNLVKYRIKDLQQNHIEIHISRSREHISKQGMNDSIHRTQLNSSINHAQRQIICLTHTVTLLSDARKSQHQLLSPKCYIQNATTAGERQRPRECISHYGNNGRYVLCVYCVGLNGAQYKLQSHWRARVINEAARPFVCQRLA